MLYLDLSAETSRRNTSLTKAHHLDTLPLFGEVGRRGWVHRALTLRVAESRRDRAEVAEIIRERHYLARWPAPPRTLLLSYIADLGGGGAAAAGMVMIALLPARFGGLLEALVAHPTETLSLVRMWRADDLDAVTAPDFTPYMLRQVVRRLPADWTQKKCQNLAARPRLLITWADPSPGVQHDGATYLAAGATSLGPTRGGKLLFAWPLDPALREPLWAYARALTTRARA